MSSNKKIAVISDKIVGALGGSESVVFSLIDLYPESQLFTTVFDNTIIPENYKNLKVKTSIVQKMPLAKKFYKLYFPIMPLAIELLNIQDYDIIFSSHHSVAKGVIPRPDAIHICYCHSPARYIWDLFWIYSDSNNFNDFQRLIISIMAQYIRIWDVTSSNRVDHFLANSSYTAARIKKFYNRNSEILYPPVKTKLFNFEESHDYYLMAGRLVAYKGYELAIEAFNDSGKRLIIVGDGPERKKLHAKAKNNITFTGKVSQELLVKYFNQCKGFIFPGIEDFGIVIAEAQSAGKPVIALRGGGALDIIEEDKTGVFFDQPRINALNSAINKAETMNWDHQIISNHANKFDINLFKDRLKEIIENANIFKSRI